MDRTVRSKLIQRQVWAVVIPWVLCSGAMVLDGAVAADTAPPKEFQVIAGTVSLSASPSSLTVCVGGSATSTITVTPSGYRGAVSLSAQISPAGSGSSAVTATLSPGSVNIGDADSQTSTLTVAAPAGATPGQYEIEIQSTDINGGTASCYVLVTVQTAAFTISPDPEDLDITPGPDNGDESTITVEALASFTGNVTVSVSQITDPSGALDGNGYTDPNAPITAAFAAGLSTNLNIPNDASDTLTVTANLNAAEGLYDITLTGTDSGNNTTTADVFVYVEAGFVLDASPQTLTIPPGGSGMSSISALAAGDAVGTPIALIATVYDDSGTDVTDPSIISASLGSCTGGTAGLTGQAQLAVGDGSVCPVTIKVGSGVASDSYYSVDIEGVDPAGNAYDTSIDITVGIPSLTIEDVPSSVSIVAGGASSVGSVLIEPDGGLSGSVSLAVASLTGIDGNGNPITGPMPTITLSPATVPIDAYDDVTSSQVTVSAGSTVASGKYTAIVTGTDGTVSATATLTIDVGLMTLSLTDLGWQPNNTPSVGSPIADVIAASITPTPGNGATATYMWTAGPAWFSLDDTSANPFAIDYPNDYSLSWQNGDSSDTTSSPSDIVTGQFFSVGWYIVEVSCTATVTNADGSSTQITGSYYIGGYPDQALQSSVSARSAKQMVVPMSSESGGKKVNTSGKKTPYVIFVHGILGGNFTNQIPGNFLIPGAEDWDSEEKTAVSNSFGAGIMYGEFAWSGNISFSAVVSRASPDYPGQLASKIESLWSNHEVAVVGYSAGGCMALAGSAIARPTHRRPSVIVRLDSPPCDPPYYNVIAPVFDAMDPWDMIVMDYARWSIAGFPGYGLTFPLPTVFPGLVGLNSGFIRKSTISTADPATTAAVPIPYLSASKVIADIASYPVTIAAGGQPALVYDLAEASQSTAIHLTANHAPYWAQLNSAWGNTLNGLVH